MEGRRGRENIGASNRLDRLFTRRRLGRQPVFESAGGSEAFPTEQHETMNE